MVCLRGEVWFVHIKDPLCKQIPEALDVNGLLLGCEEAVHGCRHGLHVDLWDNTHHQDRLSRTFTE